MIAKRINVAIATVITADGGVKAESTIKKAFATPRATKAKYVLGIIVLDLDFKMYLNENTKFYLSASYVYF